MLGTWPTYSWGAPQSVVNLSLDESLPTRWLMLRNGTVFSGEITDSGSKLTIQINPKTQMSYDPSRVWVIADSLSEIYEFFRARVQPGDLPAQIEFARWCVAQKLWDEAESEVNTLRNAGVPDQQLRGISLAIDRGRAGPIIAPTVAGLGMASNASPTSNRPTQNLASPTLPTPTLPTPTLPSPSSPSPSSPLATGFPIPQSQPGLPVGAEKPAPIVNSVFSFYDQPGFENDSRVQEAIDGSVQQEAVNQFNETVHWAMVQACAGCHYPENTKLARASSFVLDIPSAKYKATLTQTRHNLDQLLTLINRENPGNSRLLALISQPHASLKEPPLSTDSDDFRSITQWIYRSGIDSAGREQESRVIQAHAETAAADPVTNTLAAEAVEQPRLIPGSLGPESDPARPYDPQPFNRLYHPDGPPQQISPQLPQTPAIPSAASDHRLAPRVAMQPPASTALLPKAGPTLGNTDPSSSAGRVVTPLGLPRVRREGSSPNAVPPTGLRPR